MNAQTRAVIDVGTNTIKLTVARAGCFRIEPLLECTSRPNTRLGTGFYRHKQLLQRETMRAAADAVRDLSNRCRSYDPVSLRAIATSAVRDARNRDEFAALIRQKTGLSLEVLSGKTEAEWIFRGATSDFAISQEKLLVMGFGGGSTAVIVSDLGRIQYRSFDLGAVRLMELLHLGVSPTANDLDRCQIYLSQFFNELITPELNSMLSSKMTGFTLVTTGGSANSLAKIKMHAQNLHWANDQTQCLNLEEVSRARARLWRLSHEERKSIPGLSGPRCDVILPGVVILEAVMKYLGFTQMRVTQRGVRYGALLDASESCEIPCQPDSFSYAAYDHRSSGELLHAGS